MDKKMIELTSREAVMLSIAIRGFGGTYVGAKEKAKTKEEKEKYENYIVECLTIARKIESVFGVVSKTIINDDGSETVLSGGSPRKKKN